MKKMCIGDKLQIQCYKHDGKVHRCWEEAIVLDVNKDYIKINSGVFTLELNSKTISGKDMILYIWIF